MWSLEHNVPNERFSPMALHVRFSFFKIKSFSWANATKLASEQIISQVSHASLPSFPHSSCGARAAAHLLQGLQGRRAPSHCAPGRADRRHPHRPCGAFPCKCSKRERRLFFFLEFVCFVFFHTITRTLSLTSLHVPPVDPHLRQPPPVRLQGLQLDPPHCHHHGPAGRHQCPGHLRPHHQGHLWIHR